MKTESGKSSALPACASATPLQVSANQRYLVEADGTPFLYLADTAWELFHKLDREEATYYLENRAAKGFTVIQAVLLPELGEQNPRNAYGDPALHESDPARPSEAYFVHVDFIVRKAAELGLQMALFPSWGDKVPSSRSDPKSVIFDPAKAAAYGEFVGARYRGQGVFWVLGGDRAVENEEARAIWMAMAAGIERGAQGEQLLSFHPDGDRSSFDYFPEAAWLDFHTYQSGHSAPYTPVYKFAATLLQLEPRKPFVDSEPPYEDIPVKFWIHMDRDQWPHGVPSTIEGEDGLLADQTFFHDGFFGAHDVRVHGYWNFLAGAAGYAYGHNAVWQMRRPGDPAAIPTLQYWKEALDRPGARHMRHLGDLFRSRPHHVLRPAQDMIAGKNPPSGPDHVRAACAEDGSFALIYSTRGQSLHLHLDGLSLRPLVGWWFDPRTGAAHALGEKVGEPDQTFTPPTSGATQDWLLVLEAKGAFVEAPGIVR